MDRDLSLKENIRATKIYARVAQLVEHHLAKVDVAGSSPVSRSRRMPCVSGAFLLYGWMSSRQVGISRSIINLPII